MKARGCRNAFVSDANCKGMRVGGHYMAAGERQQTPCQCWRRSNTADDSRSSESGTKPVRRVSRSYSTWQPLLSRQRRVAHSGIRAQYLLPRFRRADLVLRSSRARYQVLSTARTWPGSRKPCSLPTDSRLPRSQHVARSTEYWGSSFDASVLSTLYEVLRSSYKDAVLHNCLTSRRPAGGRNRRSSL